MKKQIIIIIFIFFNNYIFSQNTFISVISNDNNCIASSSLQLSDSTYILVGKNSSPTTDTMDVGKIYKLNKYGKIINELKEEKTDTIFRNIDITLLENNNLLVYSIFFEEGDFDSTYIYLTEYTTNLEFINRKKYTFPVDSMNITFSRMRHKDEITVLFGYYIYYKFIWIFKNNHQYFIRHEELPRLNDLQILDSNRVYFLKNIGNSFGFNKMNLNTLEITDSLKFDEIIPNYINLGNHFLEIIDSNLYCHYLVDNENLDNELLNLDTNLNLICKQTYITEDYDERYAIMDGMDFYEEHIFSLNWDISSTLFEVAKYNLDLELIFQKFVMPENPNYAACITATNDEGCLVTMNTWTSPMSIYLYKFDKDGNIPLTNLDDDIKISDYLVFPNPASDFLKIQKAVQVPEAEIVLYNSVGQTILRKKLTESITEINISNFPSGVYIYNILKDGKKDDEGKIIVE